MKAKGESSRPEAIGNRRKGYLQMLKLEEILCSGSKEDIWNLDLQRRFPNEDIIFGHS